MFPWLPQFGSYSRANYEIRLEFTDATKILAPVAACWYVRSKNTVNITFGGQLRQPLSAAGNNALVSKTAVERLAVIVTLGMYKLLLQ